MCMFTYAIPTFITEALRLVTQVQLLLTIVTVNERLIQCWLTLVRLVTTTRFIYNYTPTTYNDCSCHKSCRTCLSNHMEFISCHIMSLVINSLGVDTHTQTHIPTSAQKPFKETRCTPACCTPTAGQHGPSLKMILCHTTGVVTRFLLLAPNCLISRTQW